MCRSLFFNQAASLSCFLVNFAKFLKTSFSKNTSTALENYQIFNQAEQFHCELKHANVLLNLLQKNYRQLNLIKDKYTTSRTYLGACQTPMVGRLAINYFCK